MNRLIGPFTSQAELAPGANVVLCAPRTLRGPGRTLPAAGALSSKNAIQLLQRQPGQRVFLIDEDDRPWSVSFSPVKDPGSKHDFDRVITKHSLKRPEVRPPGRVSHDTDVGRVGT